MFDELDLYLGNITTPENREAMMQTCFSLERAGIASHESDIEQILRTADDHSTENNLLDIFSLLSEYLSNTIEKFGLSVEESVPLSVLCRILDGLLNIPEYGDPESLLKTLEQDVDDETRLCDVFSIVSSLSWYNFTPYITRVSDNLLPKMEEEINKNVQPEEDNVDVRLYRDRVNRLRRHNPDTLALTIIQEGFRLATPLHTLLGRFHDELADVEDRPETLANYLIAILYVSDTPSEKMVEKGSELLEEYAKDINVTTKAHTAFTRVLKEVQDA